MANKVSFIIALQDKYSATANKVNSANAKMKRSFSSVNDKVKKLEFSMTSLGKKTAKVGAVMTAAVSVPLALLARNMVKAASDAEETGNKFNQVFDEIGAKASAGSSEFAKSFGLADSTAQKMLGSTGDLLVGFGFTGDAAFDLSRQVNELASDLASFQNFEGGAERASESLTKALLGETESAKSLGIVIRQNTDEFRDRLKVIQRSQGVDINQAKAIAILEIAVKQSNKAIGDVGRTWGDYANVARRAEQAHIKMKESFGKDLLPIATEFNLKLTQLADALGSIEPGSRKAILVFVGLAIVLGPLLILIGGLVAAAGVIGGAWVAGIAAVVVGIGLAITYFDELKSRVMNIIALVHQLFQGSAIGALVGGAINLFSDSAPVAPVNNGSASLSGEINVSATQGTTINSTSLKGQSSGLNMGVNMVAANGG
jgi:hypothetical protein